jgi:hypothetical protein
MGCIKTLNIGLHHIVTFRDVAVMSSGWTADSDRDFFFKSEAAQIPKYNLKQAGVKIETMETPGGHE